MKNKHRDDQKHACTKTQFPTSFLDARSNEIQLTNSVSFAEYSMTLRM